MRFSNVIGTPTTIPSPKPANVFFLGADSGRLVFMLCGETYAVLGLSPSVEFELICVFPVSFALYCLLNLTSVEGFFYKGQHVLQARRAQFGL